MKIGILTLPIETGYGSIMQAFALKTALRLRGHEVVFINRLRRKKIYDSKRIIRRFIKKYVFCKWNTIVLIDKKERDEYPVVTQNTQRFIENHLYPFTSPYYSSKELQNVSELGLDAIVVGSDQVWRPNCVDNIEDYYLCNISNNIKKYSYAASLGVDYWQYTKKQTENCKIALSHFDGVSVRESGSVSLCQEHFGIQPLFVLDPTLLFDKSFYAALVGEFHDESKKDKICAFILDRSSEKLEVLNKLSLIKGKPFYFAANNTEDRQAPLQDRIAPPVECWIDSFSTSNTIFTDSFHGCVFSIIFRKEFFVFVNKSRGGGRFMSLLGLLGLENRIVSADSDFTIINPIDWKDVEERLHRMQTVSNNYLDNIK